MQPPQVAVPFFLQLLSQKIINATAPSGGAFFSAAFAAENYINIKKPEPDKIRLG